MKKAISILQQCVKKNGFSYVSWKLGFRDTGRVKNWIIRKKIPKEFELVIETSLKEKKSDRKN